MLVHPKLMLMKSVGATRQLNSILYHKICLVVAGNLKVEQPMM